MTEDNGTCSDEVANLERIILGVKDGSGSALYSVDRTITSLSGTSTAAQEDLRQKLDGNQFFFVPDMERPAAFNPSLTSDLSAESVQVLRDWLTAGGVFVMTGTQGSADVDFLNRITDWGLIRGTGISAAERNDSNAAGTPFGDPSLENLVLGNPSATESIRAPGSIPANANFKIMWGENGGDGPRAAVATMTYGAGTIIYMGFDFFNAGPTCSTVTQVRDWAEKIVPAALEYAVQLSGSGSLENPTPSGGTLQISFNDAATAYWVVVDRNAPAPTNQEVKDLSSYSGVTIAASGQSSSASTSHSVEIAGLSPAREYTVYFVGENNDGLTSVSQRNFSTVPGVPVVTSVEAGDGSVTADLTKTGEESFQYSINNGASWSPLAEDGVITGLSNGQEVTVIFRGAFNGLEGAPTTSSTVTPVGPPTAPQALVVQARDSSIDLTFEAPTFDGGAPVELFQYRLNGAGDWIPLEGIEPGEIVTITGLTNGESYVVNLRAIGPGGVGQAATSATVIPITVPSVPRGVAVEPESEALLVSFEPPLSDGGAVVSNYSYSLDGGDTWTVLDPASADIFFRIEGLDNGQIYEVSVRAINAASSEGGPASDPISAIPRTIPSAPSGLIITGFNAALGVAFTPPTDDGGSPITRYEYSLDGGDTWVSFSPPTGPSQFSISSLTNGVSYTVVLRAVNVAGFSEQSAAASGTPVAPAVRPRPRAADEPPALGLPAIPTRPPGVTATGPVSNTPPPPISGPVLSPGVTPTPPAQPTARVGTRLIPIATEVNSPSALTLRSSSVAVGVAIPETVGGVRQQPGGSTELEVRSGGQTTLQGGGVLPGSTVQVFMPLQGTNAKQVAQIQADATGAFNGNAVFATQRTEPPLPIGRQVLQIVSVDDTGQQVVMEMAVVIAQPAPAPEFDRTIDALPNLQPGSFYGMSAGEPTDLVVRTDRVQRETVIEGGDFSMSVRFGEQEIPAGEDASEAGATLTFVRDQVATVSGGGFMPGTRADVWLFSDPTLMTSVDIDDNGEFAGDIVVDGRQITVGEHTLQLQGVGTDGYVRAANLGVIVNDGDEPVATADVASSFAWWFWIIGLVALLAVAAIAFWVYRRANAAV